jgi:hypothetical protein
MEYENDSNESEYKNNEDKSWQEDGGNTVEYKDLVENIGTKENKEGVSRMTNEELEVRSEKWEDPTFLKEFTELLPNASMDDTESKETPNNLIDILMKEDVRSQDTEDPIGKGTVVRTELLALRRKPSIPEGDPYSNIAADLPTGTVVKILKDVGNDFYQVEVVLDGQKIKGYASRHYIDVMTFPEKYSTFDEDALAAKAQAIENRLSKNYIAYDPSNMDWNVSDEDVEFALTQIQNYYDTLEIQEFTILMMHIKRSGKLDVLFSELDQQHMLKHTDLIVRIAVYLSPKDAISMAQMQLIEELPETIAKETLKGVFRYPTWTNLNPIETENIDNLNSETIRTELRSQLEILLTNDNQQEMVENIDNNIKAIMKLKTAEIRYHLEKGDLIELRKQLIEIDELADASLELLFSDDPQSEYLTQTLFYPLLPLWDELKSEPESGTVYPYGMADGRKLPDVFDTGTNELIDSSKKKEEKKSNPVKTTKPTSNEPGLSSQGKTFIKELIVREAETIHQFFYKDIVQLGYEYEEMVPLINKVIEDDLKPKAYDKLASKNIGIDDESKNEDVTNKPNLDWMDLVRIWYYELGDEELGGSTDKLLFDEKAKTTKAIQSHATVQQLVAYARARVAKGDYSAHKPFVHYDVSGFYKAIASKDATFNLLGSFSVAIEPDKSNRVIKFTIINTSGKESATRFRRDNSKGRGNKVGMFEDTERGEEGVPHLGGNLSCEWSWEEPF